MRRNERFLWDVMVILVFTLSVFLKLASCYTSNGIPLLYSYLLYLFAIVMSIASVFINLGRFKFTGQFYTGIVLRMYLTIFLVNVNFTLQVIPTVIIILGLALSTLLVLLFTNRQPEDTLESRFQFLNKMRPS